MEPTNITLNTIRSLATNSSYEKGTDYFEDGSVIKQWREGDTYWAHVEGQDLYTVTVRAENDDIEASCTCPYDREGICKHVVAVLLTIHAGRTFEEQENACLHIERLVESVTPERAREFLARILGDNPRLLRDFKIFAQGKEETAGAADDYKEEVLIALDDALTDDEHYYHDGYSDDEESPVADSLESFFETAQKYVEQENFREAVKVYRGICDACMEAAQDQGSDIWADDLVSHAGEAAKQMAENLSRISLPLEEKRGYLDYFLSTHNLFHYSLFCSHFLPHIVKNSDDAAYLLEKSNGALEPPITFALLMSKGDQHNALLFGETHYREYPEIATGLCECYAKQGRREKGIEIAEKTLKTADGWHHQKISKMLREFLDRHYLPNQDHAKIVDNLMHLLMMTRDITHYQKLRTLPTSEDEKHEVMERLRKLLEHDDELLLQIYSIEDDYGALLELAKQARLYGVFHAIVEKIRERFPQECFGLYRKKLDRELKEVSNRARYRQIADYLKLMREIPNTEADFRKYISDIRVTYKKRRALLDEIKKL